MRQRQLRRFGRAAAVFSAGRLDKLGFVELICTAPVGAGVPDGPTPIGICDYRLGMFRPRARYFCGGTKVPKKPLRNQWFLRISFGETSRKLRGTHPAPGIDTQSARLLPQPVRSSQCQRPTHRAGLRRNRCTRRGRRPRRPAECTGSLMERRHQSGSANTRRGGGTTLK